MICGVERWTNALSLEVTHTHNDEKDDAEAETS